MFAPSGPAALADVLTTLRRRMPALSVIVYPVPVQGTGAAAQIAAAIATANARQEVDVLIVCRGGGSLEDLWAFNEEIVARAVFESALPIVSGVGHETDFTICDFVADARAPTPTAAAALVAPERLTLLAHATAIARRWQRAAERGLEARMQRVDLVSRRLVHPAQRLAEQHVALANRAHRLRRAADAQLRERERELVAQSQRLLRLLRAPPAQATSLVRAGERFSRGGRERLATLAQRLVTLDAGMRHLNPQGVLERGYSIATTAAGAIVHDAAEIAPGDALQLRFARGAADVKTTATRGDD